MMEKTTGVLARALYNNQPESKNELFFRKGDVLTVIEIDYEGQRGWWLCALRGKRGICPENYLELIEDKYAQPCKSKILQNSEVSENISTKPSELALRSNETYDIPRSHSNKRSGGDRPSAIYANENFEENGNENCVESLPTNAITKVSPLELYDVPNFELPTYATLGTSLARTRRQYGNPPSTRERLNFQSALPSSSTDLSKTVSTGSSSEQRVTGKKYTDQIPIIRRSQLRRTADNETCNNSVQSMFPKHKFSVEQEPTGKIGFRPSESSNSVSPTHPKLSEGSLSSQGESGIRLRYSQSQGGGDKSQRCSFLSESAESGIVMVSSTVSTPMQDSQDLYDVPRSYTAAAAADNGHGHENLVPSSRPQSSMSMSSSGMGLSIANSGSKDSLDMYDVPRSVHSYVSHLETKYDSADAARSTIPPQGAPSMTHSRAASTCGSTYSGYGYGHRQSIYKVPPSESSDGDWDPRKSLNLDPPISDELYDVPRSQKNVNRDQKSSWGGSALSVCSSLPSHPVKSQEEEGGATYDVPVPYARKVLSLFDSTETLSCPDNLAEDAAEDFSLILSGSSSHLPSTSNNYKPYDKRKFGSASMKGSDFTDGGSGSHVKILPLGPKAAVSVCERLRQEVVKSTVSILDHVKPKWRSKANLTEIMPEIRFSATRLNLAIKDLCDFCSRSLSNAIKLGDTGIQTKLHRLLTPLINASQIIQRDLDELEAYFWSVDRLSVSHSHVATDKNASSLDALDQLVLCARSLKHDVTEVANFLALNSSALFKEADTPQDSTAKEEEAEVEPEDYDYVSLVPIVAPGKGSSEKNRGVENRRIVSGPTIEQGSLDWRDEQLLEFYSVQIGGTAPLLSQSISTFISAIHQNEPPKVFNGHLKYVILLAYKMLFAGDTVHRNLIHPELKEQIENKANELNKSIVALTEASKVATRDFPKFPPMQAIIDRVWETTAAATQLKKVIFNATCALL